MPRKPSRSGKKAARPAGRKQAAKPAKPAKPTKPARAAAAPLLKPTKGAPKNCPLCGSKKLDVRALPSEKGTNRRGLLQAVGILSLNPVVWAVRPAKSVTCRSCGWRDEVPA